MNEDILMNITPQETRVALVFEGEVQELHFERASVRGMVGNIYLGRVIRVLPGIQSAFVDIGLERAAFLHAADIFEPSHDEKEEQAPVPIEHLLHEGQKVTVQTIKDPIGGKGARLSMRISIVGRMLVYLPHSSYIGISQRIVGEAEREMLRERMLGLRDSVEGGFIVRTVAEEASDAELIADIDYLRKIWIAITERAKTAVAPALLYHELNLAQRMLRDFASEKTPSIQIDCADSFQQLQKFSTDYIPALLPKLVHYTGDPVLFEKYGVEEEIERAIGRRVALKSGGYLIIDQTEALTTIDVNTGSFVSGRNFEDTIFKTNLEATSVIARQLRLRNLGGIIIIDFIDMAQEDCSHTVLTELNKALARDYTKMTVSGFSALGLVEVTRKRTRDSLSHLLCEVCPACHGRGQVKTAQTVCYEVLREVEREVRQFNPHEVRILASQAVVDLLREKEAPHLVLLEKLINKPVFLQVEVTYTQENYDIVLM